MAKQEKEKKKNVVVKKYGNGGGAAYGIGVVGALFYFISHAPSFWEGVLGVVKAFFWPAILVYGLLDFLNL